MAPSEQLPAVGTVQLQLNGSSFFAGDELSGTVRLTLEQAIQDALITVQVNGLQRLHWAIIARDYSTKHDQLSKHLETEFHLGELNGAWAAGIHELPFTVQLPHDLIANATMANIIRKQVDDYRHVRVDVEYDVIAKLEGAGLSNKSLLQKQAFTIAPLPVAVPLGSPIKTETTEHIKALGFARGGSCTVRMEVAKDVAHLPTGTISVDVEIELPPKRKPYQIKLILYEDVFVDRGSHIHKGTRHVPRDICFKVYKPKHLTVEEGPGLGTTLRGTLQLTITDPDKEWFGAITPSVASKFLQIRHRVGVDCVFLLGTTVKVSAAITLVDRTSVATALPA